MEQTEKFNYKLNQLESAYNRLEESVDQKWNEFIQDSVIQRFEFTFELFWKVGKLYLQNEGFDINSPRQVIKSLFEMNIIKEVELFMDLLETRNLCSHIYDEKEAEKMYNFIIKNYQKIGEVITLLKKN